MTDQQQDQLLTGADYQEWSELQEDYSDDYTFKYRSDLPEPFTCVHHASQEPITATTLATFTMKLDQFDRTYYADHAERYSDTLYPGATTPVTETAEAEV